MHNLHTLTALTGRNASANRTMIVGGTEFRRQHVVIAVIGALPAIVTTVVLWSVIGQYAVLALFAVEGLTFWLLGARSRHGLQQRTFEALLDKKRSDAGKFSMCGKPIDPELNEIGTLISASVPNPFLSTGPAAGASQPVTPPLAAGPASGSADPSIELDMFVGVAR